MSKPKTPPRERTLGLTPAPVIAIVDTDVWRVRRLSELLQACGARVLLLGSSSNAMQLLPSARCDLVVLGDGLTDPSGPALCDELRATLGGDRPYFVRLRGDDEGEAAARGFDASVIESADDESLLAALLGTIHARRAAVAVAV